MSLLPDERRVRPSTDAERILGQIDRSEIRAGRDAAREIAARAEAAYGAAWPHTHPCRTVTVPRLPHRQLVDHAAVAAAAQTRPGIWHLVGEYRSTHSAKGMAACIRSAGGNQLRSANWHYGPAGSFEATTRLTEFGCEVLVRYVGEPNEDAAWDNALAALSHSRKDTA